MKKENFFERTNQRTMVMMDIIRNYRRVETQQLVPIAEAGKDAPLPSRITVEILANNVMTLSEEIVKFIDGHYFQKIRYDDKFDDEFYDTLKWCHNNPGERKTLSTKFRIPDSVFSESDVRIIEKYPDILTTQIGRIIDLAGCKIGINKLVFNEDMEWYYYEFIFHDVIDVWVD